jgi:hypothetical protein
MIAPVAAYRGKGVALDTRPWTTVFNGTSTVIDGGSEATLDNLMDNAFTVELWCRLSGRGTANSGQIACKTTNFANGWMLQFNDAANAKILIPCATVTANAYFALPSDNVFRHIAFTFDDAGTRKVRVFIGGVEVSYLLQATGVGAVVSDAAGSLAIGGFSIFFVAGAFGWVRISNAIRYTTPFTPASLNTPPAADAQTVRLYKMNEGTGTVITDSSPNAQNATLANGTWSRYP